MCEIIYSFGTTNEQVFSKRTCGYCDAVKNLLRREVDRLSREVSCNVSDLQIVELDGSDASVIQQQYALQRYTGINTVPQVFINTRFVGGADDTARMARAGALRLALMEAARCPLPTESTPDQNYTERP